MACLPAPPGLRLSRKQHADRMPLLGLLLARCVEEECVTHTIWGVRAGVGHHVDEHSQKSLRIAQATVCLHFGDRIDSDEKQDAPLVHTLACADMPPRAPSHTHNADALPRTTALFIGLMLSIEGGRKEEREEG